MDSIIVNLDNLIELVIDASENTLNYWRNTFDVKYKQDKSPITEADLTTNKIICDKLKELYPSIPIISEENESIPYEIRTKYSLAWLIDPIDGTKEFISGGSDFTVNIGLISNNVPILGLVSQPAKKMLYFGWLNNSVVQIMTDLQIGAYKLSYINVSINRPIAIHCSEQPLSVIVASKSHMNKETEDFLAKYPNVQTISVGSSIKILRVAEGLAQLYPRLGPTSEWDIGAAHAILIASGGKLMALKRDEDKYKIEQFIYNKPSLLNGWFICGHENILLGEYNYMCQHILD